MAQYSLFVLKMLFNTKQTNKLGWKSLAESRGGAFCGLLVDKAKLKWKSGSKPNSFCSSKSSFYSNFVHIPVLWSRDHGLETRVHFVQVLILVSRPDGQGLGLGLKTWSPRSRSWSQDSMLSAYACSTITV